MVMELVDGIALRKFCGKPNSVAQVAKWGIQVAEALAAAHAGGVVHRDIKPENLMIRPDGYLKVLDFGVAAQVGTEDDLAGIPIGTLGYMSPEHVEGKPLTGASDVFALRPQLTETATELEPVEHIVGVIQVELQARVHLPDNLGADHPDIRPVVCPQRRGQSRQ
jgi:serine/threonine-protein kinase